MKKFSSLKDLWDYMEFCPACRNKSREIVLSVGSSELITLDNHYKDDNYLILETIWKGKTKVKCVLNLQDGSYKIDYLSKKFAYKKKFFEYFFFFLESECPCNACSYATSQDIDFPINKNIISDVSLEREGCFALHNSNGFHINYAYDLGKMYINSVDFTNKKFDKYDYVFGHKKLIFPIIDLDFSDPQAVIKKIKTIILFS